MATPKMDFPPVRACIFDMDGLLIDSEDIYTLVTNIILHEHGRPSLPWSIKAQLQGRPGPEAGPIFHAWAQLPLTLTEFLARQSALQRQHFPSTQPLPGVPSLLSTLSSCHPPNPTPVHLALATSSNAINYSIKTAHLPTLFDYFPPSQRILGDDVRVRKGRGKPAPDIYLLALETINDGIRSKNAQRDNEGMEGQREVEVKPEECLVFEDSVPGVEAGRRAGMRVIWCPHPGLLKEYKGREEEALAGLTGAHKDEDEKAEVVEEEAQAEARAKSRPGKIGDGWGQLLETLEDFPYPRYRISIPEK